jgi:hypothetical protein
MVKLQIGTHYWREKRKLENEIEAVEKLYAPSLKGKKGADLEAELPGMRAEMHWAELAPVEWKPGKRRGRPRSAA